MWNFYCTLGSLLRVGSHELVNLLIDDVDFMFGMALGTIHHILDETKFGRHIPG